MKKWYEKSLKELKLKKIFVILGIILVVLIALILIFNLFGLLSLNIFQSTTYNSISYSKDKITYSNIDRQGSINGFTSTHRNGESSGYSEYGMANRGLFVTYLSMNGINPSSFSAGGYKTGCTFSPINANQNNILYQSELESLGFSYMAQEEGYHTSTGDAGLCGYDGCCASMCWSDNCGGNLNRACVNGGYGRYVVTGYNACWTGNYKSSLLNEMANKMTCNVKGSVNSLCSTSPVGASDRCVPFNQNYNIQGKISYSSGFICEVDDQELFNQLPKTMIQPSDGRNVSVQKIGITGTVEFKLAIQKTFYRFENNLCTPVSILENAKLSNDYSTSAECQLNIKKPIIVYRLENNQCVPITIMENEKESNDYNNLVECKNNLITPPTPPISPLSQFFQNIWSWIKSLFEDKK